MSLSLIVLKSEVSTTVVIWWQEREPAIWCPVRLSSVCKFASYLLRIPMLDNWNHFVRCHITDINSPQIRRRACGYEVVQIIHLWCGRHVNGAERGCWKPFLQMVIMTIQDYFRHRIGNFVGVRRPPWPRTAHLLTETH